MAAIPIDAEAIVANPLLYYVPIALSLAVFFYSMVFRMAAGGIMRPIFTALAVFAILSALSHALFFSNLGQAEMIVVTEAFSAISLLAIAIALYRSGKLL